MFRPIGGLKPLAGNTATHSGEQVAQVAASIVEWGWTNPILVGADDGMVAGHCRLSAARKLYDSGKTLVMADGTPIPPGTVPTLSCVGWPEAKLRAYAIADNRLPRNAGQDTAALAIDLAGLMKADFDVSLIGFAESELAEILRGTGAPEPPPSRTPPAFTYKEQYGVIAICDDEAHQERVYNEMRAAGYKCRVVAT